MLTEEMDTFGANRTDKKFPNTVEMHYHPLLETEDIWHFKQEKHFRNTLFALRLHVLALLTKYLSYNLRFLIYNRKEYLEDLDHTYTYICTYSVCVNTMDCK